MRFPVSDEMPIAIEERRANSPLDMYKLALRISRISTRASLPHGMPPEQYSDAPLELEISSKYKHVYQMQGPLIALPRVLRSKVLSGPSQNKLLKRRIAAASTELSLPKLGSNELHDVAALGLRSTDSNFFGKGSPGPNVQALGLFASIGSPPCFKPPANRRRFLAVPSWCFRNKMDRAAELKKVRGRPTWTRKPTVDHRYWSPCAPSSRSFSGATASADH